MKTTAKNSKNSWILAGIIPGVIGILLISGCIGGEQKEPEPAGEIEEPTGSQEEKTGDEVKEDAIEPDEKEVGEDTKWCVQTEGKNRVGGVGGWVEGIVTYKGKEMCHTRYYSENHDGLIWYDWYNTKNDEEVYKKVTYPNGTVEETKVDAVPKIEEETETEIEKAPGWCVPTEGRKQTGGVGGWVEGIVEYKGKEMCHTVYYSGDARGILTRYDWYTTESSDELYKVTTYPDGTVEEEKVD